MFRLREMRKRSGMQQKDVASMLGISAQRLSNWEHGTRELNLSDACRLSEILGCTLDELAGIERHGESLSPQEGAVIDAMRSTDERGRTAISLMAASQRIADER